jgi:hypothetical protein
MQIMIPPLRLAQEAAQAIRVPWLGVMRWLVPLLVLASALPALAAPPLVPDLIQSFENTSGRQSDEWGAATAIDGGYAVVGAPGVENGRAFVYARQRTAGQEDRWVLEATLESGEATISTFGSAVAISGQTIAVGTRHVRGGLYIFERNATTGTWSMRQVFNDNTLEFLIGSSIAIDGDVMVAGTENISFVDAPGEAWVYRRGPAGWAREAVLKGSAYEKDDESGTAVDVQGGTIVFGAPDLFDPVTNELGSIFVFRHDGSRWNEVQRIRARKLAERRIGRSLRLDQDRLASISSGQNPDNGYFGQAVQVFERQPGTVGEWTLAQTVWPSDITGAGEIFAMLAFKDGLLVVNGRTPTNYDTEVYALERRSDPFDVGSWVPAHPGSLAEPAPTGLGVTGAVGDFSEGVLLMGFPRWTRSGLPSDIGAHHFARLLPHPDAPNFVGLPTAVEAIEGKPFSLAVRAADPVGGNVVVSTDALPSWLSFVADGSGGGTLSGTPGPRNTGSSELTFAAETSPGGLRTRQKLQLSVLPAASPPVITGFSASGMAVAAGESVTLYWRVLGADSITLKPSGETLESGEGSLVVRPARSTTYLLEAVNPNGVTRAEVRINVPIFGAPIRIDSPGTFLNASAAADYDGDGDLDLMAIFRGPNRFGWSENLLGSFAPPTTLQTGFGSPIGEAELLPVDMDGDGDIDVLYPEFGNLWYFRSLGQSAGFAPAVSIYQAQFPSPLRVTDVDGDGQLDVVLVVDVARIVWLRQNNGTFSLAGTILTAASLDSIAISDLDRDGRYDIVFTRWNGGGTNIHLGWLRNLGGQFSSPIYIESPAQDTRLVETGDLDGDGLPDVLTAGFNNDTIAWRRNLGNGRFGRPVQITNRTDTPTDLLAADLDGDGDLDVAVTSGSDSEVSWFENLGAGKFGGQQIITTGVERPDWLQAADVDGDGDLDLMTRGLQEGIYWVENENDPPAPGDVPPLRLIEDSPSVELDLAPFFNDPQDPDEELVYAVVGITGDPLLASAALSADGRKLVVELVPNAVGSARVLVRATDPRGLTGKVELPVEVTERVDLALQVVRDRAVAGAPDVVVHRVEISNRGPSDATALMIDLLPDLPAGVAQASAIPSAGTYREGLWEIPELPEGGSASLVMSYTVSGQANGAVDSVKTSATLQAVAQPRAMPGELSASAATSIVSPGQVAVGTAAKPVLDRQTGLFTQVITIRNDNPLVVSSVRVVVLGMPPEARVQNAHGTTADNLPYIDCLANLPPGGQTTLTIEFYIPNRVTVVPTYRAVAVFTTAPPAPKPAASAPVPERMMMLPGGSFLIEFPSVAGRTYAIEYSADLKTWQRVVSTVTAAANRTQWIDNGPPKTNSHPASVPQRYYRFVTLPE